MEQDVIAMRTYVTRHKQLRCKAFGYGFLLDCNFVLIVFNYNSKKIVITQEIKSWSLENGLSKLVKTKKI